MYIFCVYVCVCSKPSFVLFKMSHLSSARCQDVPSFGSWIHVMKVPCSSQHRSIVVLLQSVLNVGINDDFTVFILITASIVVLLQSVLNVSINDDFTSLSLSLLTKYQHYRINITIYILYLAARKMTHQHNGTASNHDFNLFLYK